MLKIGTRVTHNKLGRGVVEKDKHPIDNHILILWDKTPDWQYARLNPVHVPINSVKEICNTIDVLNRDSIDYSFLKYL